LSIRARDINDVQVRELYREQVALERDYATKLQVFTRKASEKKARTTATLVLGNEPTKVWDENTLRQRSGYLGNKSQTFGTDSRPSTLDDAYAQIITSMTLSAQDHNSLADAITSQVIDVLKSLEKKCEETKKKVRPVVPSEYRSCVYSANSK
jgi:hypothetical protein